MLSIWSIPSPTKLATSSSGIFCLAVAPHGARNTWVNSCQSVEISTASDSSLDTYTELIEADVNPSAGPQEFKMGSLQLTNFTCQGVPEK